MSIFEKPFFYLLKGLILFYRYCISPLLPARCRYIPSCSSYALEAIRQYGPFKGGWIALKRLLRCHPFSKNPLYDPVPSACSKEEADSCTHKKTNQDSQ